MILPCDLLQFGAVRLSMDSSVIFNDKAPLGQKGSLYGLGAISSVWEYSVQVCVRCGFQCRLSPMTMNREPHAQCSALVCTLVFASSMGQRPRLQRVLQTLSKRAGATPRNQHAHPTWCGTHSLLWVFSTTPDAGERAE